MSKPRELSKIFTVSTEITTDAELISTVNSASAHALSEANDYTDSELSSIDLTSTINTASAAAFASASAYTDSAIASFEALPDQTGNEGKYLTTDGSITSWGELDLDSAVNTASAAAYASASAYTNQEINALIGGAPDTLDTLNEIAAALEDNPEVLDLFLTKEEFNSASASFYRWTKTYSASATVIEGSDDNEIILLYTPGYEQVFINGVMIEPSEYTRTSASVITLDEAIAPSDVVDIFAYRNAFSTNTYSQAQIDAKYNSFSRWQKIYTIPGDESFTVTNDGSGAYVVGGVSNPTFNLVKGNTYTFVINASGHPFWIQTVSGGYSSGDVYSTGTTNLGTDNGTITWVIPSNAPDTLYYACQFHSSMQGTINLIDPAKITGSDDNMSTLSYTSGYEQVYLNGILLTQDVDYTQTNSSTITLNQGVVTNDVIEILSFQPFNIADTYTQTEADNKFLSQTSASSTYLTQDSASSTYLEKVNHQPSFRNLIINGDMAVWERNTSFANPTAGGTNFYTADRWGCNRNLDTTGITVSRSTDAPTNFLYSLKHQRVSGNASTQPMYIYYSAETIDSYILRGKNVVISFYAKVGQNYSGGAFTYQVQTGTGTDQRVYSMTGSATPISSTATLTTSWQRFSATGTFASNITQFGLIMFWTPSGTASTDDSIYITGIQVEEGTTLTNFEFVPFQVQLTRCQRYFYKQNSVGYFDGNSGNSTVARGSMKYAVRMRAAPTITVFSGTYNSGTQGHVYISNTNSTTNIDSVSQITDDGWDTIARNANLPNSGYLYACSYRAEVEI